MVPLLKKIVSLSSGFLRKNDSSECSEYDYIQSINSKYHNHCVNIYLKKNSQNQSLPVLSGED